MSSPASNANIAVSFEFEEAKPCMGGVIEPLARFAQLTAQQTPFLAASCPFFDAAKAADWFSGAAFSPANARRDGSGIDKVQRLRAITYGSEILLENTFSSDGRIAATRYFNGEVISHDWDDLQKLHRIHSKSGREMLIKLRGDTLPLSISYDGAAPFQYDYDANGNVIHIEYPDGMRTERSVGQRGELASVKCGPLITDFHWTDYGDFDGYSIRDGATAFTFRSKAKQHHCHLKTATSTSGFSSVHSLGAWKMNGGSAIEEMITPWGDRFCVRSSTRQRPTVVWSSAGQQCFHYDRSGSLAEISNPNGSHCVLYPIKEEKRALLISPRGVMLLDFDEAGHLRKTIGNDGQYNLINYTHAGSLKNVADPAESVSVARDRNGLVVAIYSDSGYCCRFGRSTNGCLEAMICDRFGPNPGESLVRFLKFLWLFFGVRTPFAFVSK
jgi:hypothetical protein